MSNIQKRSDIKLLVVDDREDNLFSIETILERENYDIVKAATTIDKLGAELATLDPKKAKDLGLTGGVVVKKINDGVINDQTRMRDGFIITKANGKPVTSLEDLKGIIGSQKEVTITGVYPGYNEPFEYPLVLDDSGE